MFTKVGVLALCAAASFNGATAAHHRHRHPKRDVVYAETDVVVVTEYETHTVYAGEEPTVSAASVPTSVQEAEKATSTPQVQNTPVVVPTTTEAAPAPTTPTTLATLVKPSAVDIPIVSQAAAELETIAAAPTVVETTTSAPAPAAVETTSAAPVAVEATTAAPAVVTSSSAPATTSAATSSTSGSKRGAAYNDVNMLEALLGKTNAISWVYNWGYDAGDLNVDVPYYPTMWGEKFAADWPAAAEAAIAKGTEVMFSFNEPDNAGQANMAATYAAAKHQEWMNPYAGQARIGAPAISSSENADQGIDWLNQFFDACDGKCQVDFCNAHWYGPGGDSGAELFLDHLKAVRDVEGCQGKSVWVTEFMPEGSDSDNETFLKKITESLESSDFDFVEKYSYFMVGVGASYLMSSETELNALGNIYANLS